MSSFGQQREQKYTAYLTTFAKDLVTVCALGILLICVHELGNPFIRGFQCDDETIRYPYKDSTISSKLCYFGGSGLNIVLILVFEFLALAQNSSVGGGNQNERSSREAFDSKLYTRNIYCRLIIWLFGGITSELLTDIFKFSAGRLRPHFIEVCQPVIRANGTDHSLDDYCMKTAGGHHYITDYYCSGLASKQRDARLSFLSGHSSYAAYSAAFAVFYIQATVDGAKYGLVKPACQVLLIATAFYTGLTRISDYKHHWQDVLAGLSLGTLVAATMLRIVWPSFVKAYNRCSVGPNRSDGDHVGEELNRVSY